MSLVTSIDDSMIKMLFVSRYLDQIASDPSLSNAAKWSTRHLAVVLSRDFVGSSEDWGDNGVRDMM